MTSSMTPKNPKKWHFFYKAVFLYDNKKGYFKKGPREGLALNTSFQTKKKYLTLYCTVVAWRWRYVAEPMFWEKRETSFWNTGFCKKTWFILRISPHRQMIKFWFFFQKIRREKLYKILYEQIWIDSFWWFLPYSKWKAYVIVLLDTIFSIIKILEDFFILHISQLEKMIKSWFVFKGASLKAYKSCINKSLLTCSNGVLRHYVRRDMLPSI